MTLTEELITQAQNFDKGSALRSLLERAAHCITTLETSQPTTIQPTPLHPLQEELPSIPISERRKPRKDV